MKPKILKFLTLGIGSLALIIPFSVIAQQPGTTFQQGNAQSTALPVAQTPPQTAQAISQTGLLPVYGVDLRLDPSWVDSKQFPSQSANFANSGTSATFQQVWAALQPGGYNVLRIRTDVSNANAAANRVANLCVWAKNNNVQLILTLTGSETGPPLGANYATQVSTFVKALVVALQSNGGQHLPDYSRVMAYQLDDELNHVGRHGGMAASVAQQVALRAAHSLRQSELEALNGTGLGATPLLASASFDFELVKAGAIAGGTMTDAEYAQAYQALKQFLGGMAASPDVDLIAVDWFAGSIGGGALDKGPDFLKSLLADVPGKQIILTTGFSTAFRSADEQKRLFATAFANLSDYRASVGTNCPFVGTIFREAMNGSNSNPNPPRATLPGEMAKWDWQAKAAELMAMWTQKKKSPDMTWWLTKVENNMGVVNLHSDASGKVTASPLPAQQGMVQIASAVSDVNAQMAINPAAGLAANPYGPAATSNPSSAGAYPGGANSNQQFGQQTGALGGTSNNTGASTYGQQPGGQFGQLQGMNGGISGNDPANPYAQQLGAQYGQQTGTGGGNNGANPCTQQLGGQFGQQPTGGTTNFGGNNYGQQPGAQFGQQPGAMGASGNYGGNTFGQQPSGQFGQQPNGMGGTSGNYGGSPCGLDQSLMGEAQKGLLGLLDAVFTRLGTSMGGGNGGLSDGSAGFGAAPAGLNYNNGANGQNGFNGNGQPISPSNLTASANSGQSGPISQGTLQVQNLNLQPSSPQVGQSVSINATLQNLSSTDISGVVVQVVGSDGNTYGQESAVHVAPNSTSPLQISWTPAAASSALTITLNVGDGLGNQVASAQLGPITLKASPTSGSSPAAPTQGAAKLSIGAVKISTLFVGSSGQGPLAQADSATVKISNPYMVAMSNIKGTLLVDGNPVQTQSMGLLMPEQSRSMLFQGINIGAAGQHEVSVVINSQRPGAQPQTSTLTQQVKIPQAGIASSTPSAIRGAGGNTNANRLSTAESSNVRSVVPATFQIGRTVVPARAGALPTNELSARRNQNAGASPNASLGNPGASPSSTVRQISTEPRSGAATTPGVRPVSSTPSVAAGNSAGSISLPPPPVRPGVGGTLPTLPERPGPGGMMASGTTSASGSCRAPVAGGIVDLSITGPDAYNISNAQPRLNQNVTFTITIRNVGTAAVPSASITFLLYADGTPVGAPRQISFSMAGGSGCTARVTWTATLPRKGRSMQLATSVIANGDVNTANNSNRWSFPAAR